jgi:threonine/homoserine/homoserine lactone efflux protein
VDSLPREIRRGLSQALRSLVGMPSLSVLPVFAAAALALLVFPGPSVLYITARSAAQGRRAGLVSVLGIHTGTIVHILAAAVGLSALLVASAAAFSVVKLAGAAYLVVLGVRTIAGRGRAAGGADGEPRGLRRLFLDGVVVNVLNPKTALFFLAFLPQFVDPDRGPVWTQTLALGALFTVLGVVSDGTYALVSAQVGQWLRRRRSETRSRGRFIEGGLLIGLGVSSLAIPHRRAD